MAVKLQIDEELSPNAQTVKDENGKSSSLTISSDSIGVGSTSPKGKLEVNGGNAMEGGWNKCLVLKSDHPSIQFDGGATSKNSAFIAYDAASSTEGLEFVVGSKSEELMDGKRSMKIRGNGNVGIGTMEPENRLQVQGGSAEFVTESGNNPLIISRRHGGTEELRIGVEDGVATVHYINDERVNRIDFRMHNTDTETGAGAGKNDHIVMRIIGEKTGGRVGIGTKNPKERLEVNGNILLTGDLRLPKAGDCAEQFCIEDNSIVEPGTVMVIGDEESLLHCTKAYDHKVAGVISGAGGLKPGIVLGRQGTVNRRQPLALSGKVFCKVDADHASIDVGDLLTTSPTAGYAMKAKDPFKSFGAVLGKALRPLSSGRGFVPVLVSLQ